MVEPASACPAVRPAEYRFVALFVDDSAQLAGGQGQCIRPAQRHEFVLPSLAPVASFKPSLADMRTLDPQRVLDTINEIPADV